MRLIIKNGSQQVNYLFSVWFIHANELPLGIHNDDLMSLNVVSMMSINSLNHRTGSQKLYLNITPTFKEISQNIIVYVFATVTLAYLFFILYCSLGVGWE